MKRIFIPTRSGSDWQRLLGQPKLHWKKGNSAMSTAACWEDSQPHLPAEIISVLESGKDAAIEKLELLVAIPEWKVNLPGGNRPSQTDVLAITRNSSGLVILGIEAKVEEPFDCSIEEKKAKASKGQLCRIAYLESELGRVEPFEGEIQYQLLHRTVSTLLTARKFHAPVAVMLVQSFSPKSAGRDKFDLFCQKLNCNILSPDLCEVPNINGARLLLGWCQGNKKYLEVELESTL